VPFPNPLDGLPAEYVGKTNQQLWSLYGVAIGGEIAPADAVPAETIRGLVDLTP
jgi:hypothetical protein